MKNVLLSLTGILLVFNAFAQDTIITAKGEEMNVKVIEIGLSYIKYGRSDTSVTDLFAIEKSFVFIIKYKNGTKDVFSPFGKDEPPGLKEMPDEMAIRGAKDAELYYHNYEGCNIGVVVVTIYGYGIWGLASAYRCSRTPPHEEHLGYPDETLMRNTDYSNAYRTEAFQMKKKKTWAAFRTGLEIDAAIAVIIYSLAISFNRH